MNEQHQAVARGRVLVVDDERSIRRLVAQYLEKEGYTVLEADNGEEGLAVLRRGSADVALVDVMLPGLDGFELVREARRFTDIPIILLTARGEEANRVAGLEIGADDYVVKPFSAAEVVARVRAHLRRRQGGSAQEEVVRLGEVELHLPARRCLVKGEEVDLTRREFDLLAALSERPGRALTRSQLLEAGWGTTFVTEKTVDVHLASLRRKLGGALRVTAIRGVGYRLDA